MSDTHKPEEARLDSEDPLPEYRFDYSKAKPNRFAARMQDGPVVVVLEPDVAEAFPTPDAVHQALRALIAASLRKAKTRSG